MVDLSKKPFYLTQDQIRFVEELIDGMSIEEKIGQLFIPISHATAPGYLDHQILKYKPGGVMFRPGDGETLRNAHAYLQSRSRIPMLVGANLESGGSGIAVNGTFLGSQMEVAATGDAENAYRLGKVSCSEGRAVGVNWAFAPVVDVDHNWRNPITNVRTYGDDPERVLRCAMQYKKGADEEGVAVAIKHFPGDGIDEVDHHILTSVNSLSCEEWDESYGKIYQTLIDDGAQTVMVGHIAMPAYQKKYNPDFPDELIPASLSPELLKGLLRGKLGFNGLITTDSTCMVGFSSAMARRRALPHCIESGCDMLLFNKVLAEDIQYMTEAYEQGDLSEGRLHEALERILGLKMSLGLFDERGEEDQLDILSDPTHRAWAAQVADESVTLVKDTQKLLPLSPEKTHRILLEIMGDFPSNERVLSYMHRKLEAEGFQVEDYVHETVENHDFSVETFRSKYDLVLYLGNVENASNQVTNRLRWFTFFGNGNNCPWFTAERPVLFVSLANPYHLVDIPQVKTYINAYANDNVVLDAVVEKLMGRSPFKGLSPVDPFCGKDYLKY